MIYFTADMHLGHDTFRDIRGFESKGRMDNFIVKRYNSVVTPEDTCYILGDLSMVGDDRGRYLEPLICKLNGTKVLILGNHDRFRALKYVEMGFQSVHTSLMVEGYLLVHDPCIHVVCPDDPIVCGHVHDLFKRQKNVLNVGVDVWDFRPVSLDQVKSEFEVEHIYDTTFPEDSK